MKSIKIKENLYKCRILLADGARAVLKSLDSVDSVILCLCSVCSVSSSFSLLRERLRVQGIKRFFIPVWFSV